MINKISFTLLFLLVSFAGSAQQAAEATRADLDQKWFVKKYRSYNIDQFRLEACKPELENFSVLIFMGTWCSDSREHVPPFYKIADSSGLKISKLFFVPEEKKNGFYAGVDPKYKIEFVPTFIILDETGKEIGRIVETPEISLEADLCRMVQNR